MNVTLFETFRLVLFIVFVFTEIVYTFWYFYVGGPVNAWSMFRVCFTKKHFILSGLQLIALILIWWYTGAFSNLNFVIDGMKVRRIMLEDLLVSILMGRAVAGVAMFFWIKLHEPNMLSGWYEKEEGKPIVDEHSDMKK